MQSTLRCLGYLCYIAATGCVIASLMIGVSPLLMTAGLFISGVVFFALASILGRVTYIEFLLQSSPVTSADRVKTDVGDFERLVNVEGEATCTGCGRTAPKADLYCNKAMDVYYHPGWLANDSSGMSGLIWEGFSYVYEDHGGNPKRGNGALDRGTGDSGTGFDREP